MVSIGTLRDLAAIGQGTWRFGEDHHSEADEITSLRAGIDLGMTLIDTAELYADGNAEVIVGKAILGRRDEVCVVSKVLPANATEEGTVRACHASLRRLGTDRIDVYLLHWRREVPLSETVQAFHRLQEAGDIREWGVSNLDVADLDDLPAGAVPAANQVLYNITRRGPEANLFPRSRASGTTIMAYSPIEKGRLLNRPVLVDIAQARGITPAQVALCWAVRDGDVIAVPKATRRAHIEQNAAAMHLRLSADELRVLDESFPAPGIVPLETLS